MKNYRLIATFIILFLTQAVFAQGGEDWVGDVGGVALLDSGGEAGEFVAGGLEVGAEMFPRTVEVGFDDAGE